jgi:hypothetical protein
MWRLLARLIIKFQFRIPEFHCHVHKGPPTDLILSGEFSPHAQHIFLQYLDIFRTASDLLVLLRATYPTHLPLLDIMALRTGEECQVWSSSLCKLLQPPMCPTSLLQIFFWHCPQILAVFHQKRRFNYYLIAVYKLRILLKLVTNLYYRWKSNASHNGIESLIW